MCEYFVEATKTFCHFETLVTDTLQSLMMLDTHNVQPNARVHIDSKFGIDGSGSHQIRHQLAEKGVIETEDDDNVDAGGDDKPESSYIGAFWCPLSVTLNDKTIWTNKLPNSTLFCRPLCLIREKENRASVLEHFKPYIDSAHTMEAQGEAFIGTTPRKYNDDFEKHFCIGKRLV